MDKKMLSELKESVKEVMGIDSTNRDESLTEYQYEQRIIEFLAIDWEKVSEIIKKHDYTDFYVTAVLERETSGNYHAMKVIITPYSDFEHEDGFEYLQYAVQNNPQVIITFLEDYNPNHEDVLEYAIEYSENVVYGKSSTFYTDVQQDEMIANFTKTTELESLLLDRNILLKDRERLEERAGSLDHELTILDAKLKELSQ